MNLHDKEDMSLNFIWLCISKNKEQLSSVLEIVHEKKLGICCLLTVGTIQGLYNDVEGKKMW